MDERLSTGLQDGMQIARVGKVGVVHLVKEQQLMTKVCRMISSGSKMKAKDGWEREEGN